MVSSSLEQMKISFQDGCDSIVAALTAKGSTPASNSLDDIITAINNMQLDVKHNVTAQVYSTPDSAGNDRWHTLYILKNGTVVASKSIYRYETLSGSVSATI